MKSSYDDTKHELVALCQDLHEQIKTQLSYYQASVYKDEALNLLERKIADLSQVVECFATSEVIDLFNDYAVTRKLDASTPIESSSRLKTRVHQLLYQLKSYYQDFLQESQDADWITSSQDQIRSKAELFTKLSSRNTERMRYFQKM